MDFLSSSAANVSSYFSAFFSADPSVLLAQSLTVAAVSIVVFLVLFATRDIMLRTHSFAYQIFCILIVAVLPILGFLIYLIIRPSRTNAMRTLEHKVDRLLEKMNEHHHAHHTQGKKHHHEQKGGQQKPKQQS